MDRVLTIEEMRTVFWTLLKAKGQYGITYIPDFEVPHPYVYTARHFTEFLRRQGLT